MPATRVACPSCGAGLTFGAPPPPGTRVQCPQCSRVVSPGAEAPPANPLAGPLPRHTGTGTALSWLVIAVSGVLILTGIGIGLAAYLGAGKRTSRTTELSVAARPIRAKAPQGLPAPPAPAEPARPPSDPGRPALPEPYRPGPLGQPNGLSPPPARELTTLPEDEQNKVNAAIDRGVGYLRATQSGSGGWPSSHKVGYTALPGLTMLECGVPPVDPAVQSAAALVRSSLPNLSKTYELALAILFLDRLGEPADRALIQTMALRLVAGQNGDGGWGYECPLLSPKDHDLLLTMLRETRPRSALELFVPDGPHGSFTPTDGSANPEAVPFPGGTPELKPAFPPPSPPAKKPGKDKPNALGSLPPVLHGLPALQTRLELKEMRGRSDNSNTQFAALALWAARRYDVPMERTLALLDKRFRTGQNPDGSWGYMSGPSNPDSTRPNTMTCAGLLGLALGHGVLHELQAKSRAAGQPVPVVGTVQDQGILKGLDYLSRYVGSPSDDGRAARLDNLYFLWSLERVGMLFNLKTIQGKDWYRWGAQMLVVNQNGNGSWHGARYPGSSLTIDTCFALLFLKRANLARDLTQKVEFLVEVKP